MSDNQYNILITGSAGYIGSSFAYYIKKQGYNPICVDFLQNGNVAFVYDQNFYNCDIGNSEAMETIIKKHNINTIFHFSGFIEVGESVNEPLKYYENNTTKTLRLLNVCNKTGVKNFIFSSTAAVYGLPKVNQVTEDCDTKPINPYGKSKLQVEDMLRDLASINKISYVALRYFNVAGSIIGSNRGEARRVETHLVPLILDTVLGVRPKIYLFGDDFETQDGTCVRDYIHIEDLCDAHFLALKYLTEKKQSNYFNLGTGCGNSVFEVVEATKKVVGKEFPVEVTGRRAGDPAFLVASSEKFKKEAGWIPKFELHETIRSAWEWRKSMNDYIKSFTTFDINRLKSMFNSTYFDIENNNEFKLFFAPGRINIIGEHTDYTGGLVLPAAIDKGTYILAKKNNLNKVRVFAQSFPDEMKVINLKDFTFTRKGNWSDYFFGSLKILLEQYSLEKFSAGFDAYVFGDMPLSGGLSSSASMEMASLLAFLGINNQALPAPGSKEMIELVQLARKCEIECAGVNCGIMDQFASGNGQESKAIKLQCQTLNFEYTDIKLNGYKFILSNTNKPRNLVESKYNERVAECEKGFNMIKESLKNDIKCLGEISLVDWQAHKAKLNNEIVIQKRVEHVITENERVKQTFIELAQGNIEKVGQLLNESGDSLRDNFEVTGLHLDTLVKIARPCDGVLGSRMMGAGFGGCTITLIKDSEPIVKSFQNKVTEEYKKAMNIKPDFYEIKIGHGAKEIKL